MDAVQDLFGTNQQNHIPRGSRLSERDRSEFSRLLQRGVPIAVLAKRFGISRRRAYEIKANLERTDSSQNNT